jgi:ABC-type multidrug transport system fused ATPase/permease subunit
MKEKATRRMSAKALRRSFRLFSFAAPWRAHFWVGMVCLLISSVSSLALFSSMGKLIDAQIGVKPDMVLEILGWIGIILVVQVITAYLRIYTFAIVSEHTVARIRNEVYGRLIRLPMDYFAKHRVGELNSRISSDIASIRDSMTTFLAEFIRQTVTVVGSVVILLTTSVKLALFMVGTLPVMVLVAVIFGRKVRKLSKQAQQEVADASTAAEETLQAIATVKAFSREPYESKRYATINTSIIATGLRNAVWRGSFASFIIVFIFGAVAAIVWFGSGMVGSGEITQGDLFQFFLLSVFMAGSVGGLADTYGQIQKAVGATEHLLDILEEHPEQAGDTLVSPSSKFKGKLVLEHVSFTYPTEGAQPVLQELDMTIEAGQKVAVVGASGAGKSTLAHVLLRFYTPQSGTIYLDGVDASQTPLEVWRSAFALVPQDILLFGGTLFDNIRYGRLDATQEEVEEAAKKAYAHDFILSFPQGYQTVVGERGTRLSGGQRQRVAIARAILADPAVLVLDEATSALDAASEKEVQLALQTLMKGRTSIVIAHRLSTIRDAEQIVVLDQGKIVEQGSHDALMAQKGLYETLVKLSASRDEIPVS